MKTTRILIGISMILSTTVFATNWNVDPAHSQVEFKVKHLMTRLPGHFKDFEGHFSFDEKKPATAKGDFTIKVASIDTNDAKRDGHLKSPDFFDVEKNPTIQFVANKAVSKGKAKFELKGDLTLHGVTKPWTLEVEYLGSAKDPWGNEKASFSATGKINRKDFGMVWNKTLDTGGIMIGEDVMISLEVEANKDKPADKPAEKKES